MFGKKTVFHVRNILEKQITILKNRQNHIKNSKSILTKKVIRFPWAQRRLWMIQSSHSTLEGLNASLCYQQGNTRALIQTNISPVFDSFFILYFLVFSTIGKDILNWAQIYSYSKCENLYLSVTVWKLWKRLEDWN